MKALRFIGYGWCVAIVLVYLGYWLTSDHGGGIFSQGGWGEIWLIAVACLPGVGLIKFADSKAKSGKRTPH
jgi:hypothetical protein